LRIIITMFIRSDFGTRLWDDISSGAAHSWGACNTRVAWMDRTILAAVIGAVAGFVVWLFNWFWTLFSERKSRIRIRTMLSIELEENLTALRSFYATAQSQATLTATPLAKMQQRDYLTTADLPAWNHAFWNGLVTSVPFALRPHEIRAVYGIHCGLDELSRLRASSAGLNSGLEWRDAFEDLIKRLLEAGNPVK
jgi:hypothetical protein